MITAINSKFCCILCGHKFEIEQPIQESMVSYKFFKPAGCPKCRNIKKFRLIGFEPRKIAFKSV